MSNRLCDLMNYERAVLFPRARDALGAWKEITGERLQIPTNCCPALDPFASEFVPVDPETGLAPVPVQLYGYRQIFAGAKLEIDPLMTGMFGPPFAESSIISFGYSKTIDINGGGAILTNDLSLAGMLEHFSFFPKVLYTPLNEALANVHSIVMEKKRQYEEIENDLAPFVTRLPDRPVIPWRFVAKLKSPNDIAAIRRRSPEYKISRNYPPLPGVTDPGAIAWGEKVINVWK